MRLSSRRATGLWGALQGGEEVEGDAAIFACCCKLASVEDIRPHRWSHEFSTSITRKGLDPLDEKELMGTKSDKVYGRYTQGALKFTAAKAYLQVIGEDGEED